MSEPTTPSGRPIKCPHCGRLTFYSPENPFRPFCSERCKMIDLGDWADEKYRVAAKPSSEDAFAEEGDDDEPSREDQESD